MGEYTFAALFQIAGALFFIAGFFWVLNRLVAPGIRGITKLWK